MFADLNDNLSFKPGITSTNTKMNSLEGIASAPVSVVGKIIKAKIAFNNNSKKKKSSHDLLSDPISATLVTSSTGIPRVEISVPFSDSPGSSSSTGVEAIGTLELTPLQFVIEVVGDLVYKTEEDRIKNNGSLFANWTMVFSGGFLGNRKMTQLITMPSVMQPNHRFQSKMSDSVFSGQDMPYDDKKYLSDAFFRVGNWNEKKTIPIQREIVFANRIIT